MVILNQISLCLIKILFFFLFSSFLYMFGLLVSVSEYSLTYLYVLCVTHTQSELLDCSSQGQGNLRSSKVLSGTTHELEDRCHISPPLCIFPVLLIFILESIKSYCLLPLCHSNFHQLKAQQPHHTPLQPGNSILPGGQIPL